MNFPKTFKQILLTGTFTCCSFLTFAQGAYIKIGGGYNFGIGSHYGSNTDYTSSYDPATNTFQFKDEAERVKINFGKGFTGNAAFGYMFNAQLGAELEAGYLAGGINENSDRFQGVITNKSKMHSQLVLVQPALVMVNSLSKKLSLYGKFGLVLAKGTFYSSNYRLSDRSDEKNEITRDAEFKGGLGFGLQGALGLTYKLNDKLGLYSEIKMSNLSYSPNTFELQKETLNGDDITATQTKHISLRNSYSVLNSQENLGIKESYICGYAGLNIGLKINL